MIGHQPSEARTPINMNRDLRERGLSLERDLQRERGERALPVAPENSAYVRRLRTTSEQKRKERGGGWARVACLVLLRTFVGRPTYVEFK